MYQSLCVDNSVHISIPSFFILRFFFLFLAASQIPKKNSFFSEFSPSKNNPQVNILNKVNNYSDIIITIYYKLSFW